MKCKCWAKFSTTNNLWYFASFKIVVTWKETCSFKNFSKDLRQFPKIFLLIEIKATTFMVRLLKTEDRQKSKSHTVIIEFYLRLRWEKCLSPIICCYCRWIEITWNCLMPTSSSRQQCGCIQMISSSIECWQGTYECNALQMSIENNFGSSDDESVTSKKH